MPPKKPVKAKTTTDEFLALKQQLRSINDDVVILHETMEEIQKTVSNMDEAQKENQRSMSNSLDELKIMIEKLFEGFSTSTSIVAADESSRQSASENMIGAPMNYITSNGERKPHFLTIRKKHIIQVIKASSNTLSEQKAESLYKGTITIRVNTLKTMIKRLGIQLLTLPSNMDEDETESAEQEESEETRSNNNHSMLPGQSDESLQTLDDEYTNSDWTWKKIDYHEKEIAIQSFTLAVKESTGVDYSKCVGNWATNHMLQEGWTNMLKGKYVKKEYTGDNEETISSSTLSSNTNQNILRNINEHWGSETEHEDHAMEPVPSGIAGMDNYFNNDQEINFE
ncbi:hypothetical protein BDC45DRAFT_559234 [Circinella umbellata]|nr:hypothetical protein BDC45DRAFT_559234 [Circinella umbellata]